MNYKLLLFLVLIFFCSDIAGQNSSDTITNKSYLSIDRDDEFINNISNPPLRLPSLSTTNMRLKLEEIDMVNNRILPYSFTLPSSMRLENSFLNEDFRSSPHLNVANTLNLEIPRNNNIVTPFGYHYNSRFEGVNAVGLNIRLVSTSVIDLVISPLMSITYMGHYHPVRTNNLSLQANLTINIGDAVQLKFSGRYSANQGINPMLSPMFGASNYFGGAIVVRITDKFGIEAGVRREYFMGKWTNIYYITPVFY